MTIAVRCFWCALAAIALLPTTLAGAAADATSQIVAWSGSVDCPGYVEETLTGTVTRCLPAAGGGGDEFAAAVDGSLVVGSEQGYQGREGPVWLGHPNGSAEELDSSPYDFDPDISPDGSKVTFARLDPTTWSSDIYVVNANGSGLTRVASGGTTAELTDPVLSPDGKAIAYSCFSSPSTGGGPLGKPCGPLADRSYRTSGLMLMNADGSDKRMILVGGAGTGTAGPTSLSWSFDGKWLTVVGNAGDQCSTGGTSCNTQVFAYHSDGSDLFNSLDPSRQVSHSTGAYGASAGQFCGDGLQILYVDNGNGNGSGAAWHFVNLGGSTAGPVSLPLGEPVACVPTGVGQGPPPTVNATRLKVPSVHGLRVRSARHTLAAHQLTVGTVSYKYSSIRRNRVVSQHPKAGGFAHRTGAAGPPVNLTVSRGRRPRHRSGRR